MSASELSLYRAHLLEEQNKDLQKELLGMTAIALSFIKEIMKTEPEIQSSANEYFLRLRKDVSEFEPNAPIISQADKLLRIIAEDGLALSDYASVKIISKKHNNQSHEKWLTINMKN